MIRSALTPAGWVSIFRPILSSAYKSLNVWRLKLRQGGRLQTGRNVGVSGLRGLEIQPGVTLGDGTKIVLNRSPSSAAQPRVILGTHVKIGDRNQLTASDGQTLRIGDWSSTHGSCYIAGDIEIGRYCLLSANIFISSGDHNYNYRPELLIKDQDALVRAADESQSLRTVIEDDCWIGWGTVIKRGVTIGKGSVIGANSVVTKNIPPYSVAVGTPARVIKQRLKYVPPQTLKASDDIHLPYFHTGFELRQKSWHEIDGHRVIGMSSANRCVLGCEGASRLNFTFYTDEQTEILLSLGQEIFFRTVASTGWNTIDADLPGISSNFKDQNGRFLLDITLSHLPSRGVWFKELHLN